MKSWRAASVSLLIVFAVGVTSQFSVSAQKTREAAAWRELNERARRVEPVMREAARTHGVDPRALWTIAYLETRFRRELVSPKGARGMMQFMPATATRFGLGNPHDTTAAIHGAARYVRFLAERFNNRFDLVLAGYNAGEGAVDAYLRGVALRTSDGRVINPNRIRTGGIPPYTETRNYVARGVQIARALTQSNLFAGDLAMSRGLLIMPPSNSTTDGESVDMLAQSRTDEGESQTQFIIPSSRYAANEESLEARRLTGAQIISARSIRPALAAARTNDNSNQATDDASVNAGQTDYIQPRSTYIRASAPRR